MITADNDTPCTRLGNFLSTSLNEMDTRQAVSMTLDYFPFVGGEIAIEGPMLCVFRGNSRGPRLDRSELNIGYYLFDLGAYREQPGLLRWFELAVVQLLEGYNDLDPCLELDLSNLQSRRGYLPYGNLLLPNTVLSLSFADLETLR